MMEESPATDLQMKQLSPLSASPLNHEIAESSAANLKYILRLPHGLSWCGGATCDVLNDVLPRPPGTNR